MRETTNTPRCISRLLAGAALVAGAALASTGAATAGNPPQNFGLDVDISVSGPDAQNVLDGLTVEVYTDPGGELVDPLTCSTAIGSTSDNFASESQVCSISSGNFVIGLDGVPEVWTVSGNCNDGVTPFEMLDLGGAEAFSYDGGPTAASCSLGLVASTLLIDKVVIGGDASSSDFELVVTDSGGATVTSGSDVADATCEDDFDRTECGVIVVPPGTGFFIAEPALENYELTSVECDEFLNADNPPSNGVSLAPIGDDGFRTDDGDTYCVVTNTFVPPPTTVPPTTVPPTTMPPTTVPATTVPPTTAPPTTEATTTTSIDVAVVTLPETGPSAETAAWMSAVAALMVAAGGAMLIARRRPS